MLKRIHKTYKLIRWEDALVVLLFLLFVFSPPCSSTLRAEKRLKKFLTKADSILTARYYRSHYDTTYVVRPEGRLTLKLKANLSGNSIRSKGTMNEVDYKTNMQTSNKTTISIGASYRGISLSYAINPGKWAGFYKDYELNVNYYGSRFSFDASYQSSTSLSGSYKSGDLTYRVEKDDVDMKVFNIAGYYVFNHRHFSFPAAFTQSYIQRRSCGSWLAGICYQGGDIKTTEGLAARSPQTPFVRIKAYHVGIGGGYGYNFVFGPKDSRVAKKWLLHASLLPTFVVFNYNKMTIGDQSNRSCRMNFNMLFNERLALIYNISPRYFLGITATSNVSVFNNKAVVVNQNKWVAHAFVGLRL